MLASVKIDVTGRAELDDVKLEFRRRTETSERECCRAFRSFCLAFGVKMWEVFFCCPRYYWCEIWPLASLTFQLASPTPVYSLSLFRADFDQRTQPNTTVLRNSVQMCHQVFKKMAAANVVVCVCCPPRAISLRARLCPPLLVAEATLAKLYRGISERFFLNYKRSIVVSLLVCCRPIFWTPLP